MLLTFLGAAGTITGSKYLLNTGRHKILVDCGLFLGDKALRLRNWSTFPVKPQEIDALIITHAQIDHSGYIPLLVKQGYRGPIYATPATIALCSTLLPDSGYLQEVDATHANLHHYSTHQPALPLYTKEDAIYALKQFVPIEFMQTHTILTHVALQFYPAGHILGASMIEIEAENLCVVFTGDMGRSHDPLMRAPHILRSADYLIIESAYGNRLIENEAVTKRLAKIINDTANRGGSLLIPAFTAGCVLRVLYYLKQLIDMNMYAHIPIYLDSPIAINAMDIITQHKDELKVSLSTCKEILAIATKVNARDEFMNLALNPNSKIIISANGMATGGRILDYLQTYIIDARNTILFTDFQVEGTIGDRIVRLEKEIKIHGQMYPVCAHIENITALAAHADYQELLAWLSHFTSPPRHTFLTHGEKSATLLLKNKIKQTLHWPCSVPEYLDVESLC